MPSPEAVRYCLRNSSSAAKDEIWVLPLLTVSNKRFPVPPVQFPCRDLFRLHRGLDFFRIFSLYFSGPGFYVSVMQTAWAVYFFALTHASLAIADLELYRVYRYFKMTETQTTLSLSKEEGGYYNSIYALQIGLLTLLPLLMKMIMDRGFRAGVEYTLETQLADRGRSTFSPWLRKGTTT